MRLSNFVSFALPFLISAAGITQTFSEFWSQQYLEEARLNLKASVGEESVFNSWTKDLLQLAGEISERAQYSLLEADIHYLAGKANLVGSLRPEKLEDRLSRLCLALAHFSEASKRNPHKARFHIARADLEIQLQGATGLCSKKLGLPKKTSLENALQSLTWAESLAPRSVKDLYLASLVYLGAQEKTRALDLLRKHQEVNPYLTQAVREFIYQLVASASDLKSALPHRYPELIVWSKHFSRQRPLDYDRWRSVFVDASQSALDELAQRHREGKIDQTNLEQFVDEIAAMPHSLLSDNLRRSLDRTRSRLKGEKGKSSWAAFLEERGELKRIPVAKSILKDDENPKRTMLANWTQDHSSQWINFNVLGSTLGIAIPDNSAPKMLVLEGVSNNARLETKAIKVFISDDNQTYHPLRGKLDLKEHFIQGQQTIQLKIPEGSFRYLKIHQAGTQRKSGMSNRFDKLLQVYGTTW